MTPADTTYKSDWLHQYEAECAARLALAGYTFGEHVTVVVDGSPGTSGRIVAIDDQSVTVKHPGGGQTRLMVAAFEKRGSTVTVEKTEQSGC